MVEENTQSHVIYAHFKAPFPLPGWWKAALVVTKHSSFPHVV